MIYEVKKTIKQEDGTEKVLKFEIDDLIHFEEQPEKIKQIVEKYKSRDEIECDNYMINLIKTGRLIVSPIVKEE